MTEKSRREPEISRREEENMRAELVTDEMAAAVRFLGGDGPAKQQIRRAAQAAKLPVTVIERLRWKKVKRPFADIVDQIREAVERHNEESLARAKHEAFIAKQQAQVMAARLAEIDPDFYGPEIDRLRWSGSGGGCVDDRAG